MDDEEDDDDPVLDEVIGDILEEQIPCWSCSGFTVPMAMSEKTACCPICTARGLPK